MHFGAGGKERIQCAFGWDDAVDDQAEVVRCPVCCNSPIARRVSLMEIASGCRTKTNTGLSGLAHGGQGALVLVLGILDGRRRADAGLPAARAGRIDGLAPLGGQLQQADGVTGGGGVEDDHIKSCTVIGGHIQKIGEAVEGGHFRRAGAAHLLFHHLHHLRREGGADGRHGAVDVLLGGVVGVDFHRPQIGDARNRRDVMADFLLEDICQVGGRVGGDDQRALALVGIAHGLRAGHAGLAHAAFTGEEDELVSFCCSIQVCFDFGQGRIGADFDHLAMHDGDGQGGHLLLTHQLHHIGVVQESLWMAGHLVARHTRPLPIEVSRSSR